MGSIIGDSLLETSSYKSLYCGTMRVVGMFGMTFAVIRESKDEKVVEREREREKRKRIAQPAQLSYFLPLPPSLPLSLSPSPRQPHRLPWRSAAPELPRHSGLSHCGPAPLHPLLCLSSPLRRWVHVSCHGSRKEYMCRTQELEGKADLKGRQNVSWRVEGTPIRTFGT